MHKIWALALLGCGLPAFAWGPEGHNLVARIAEAELTPAARARVAEILGPGVSLASISSWPDQIRRDRPETAPWHYIDIPINKKHLDTARDCPKGDCVTSQISRMRGLLLDPATPASQRREALMFLVHFVADMHQPLHCSDNNDKGGNGVQVILFDRPSNLHSTWDSGLLGRMGAEEALFPGMLAEARKHEGKWSGGNVEKWADESHKAARKVVYGKLPAARPAPLGAAYELEADKVIRVQIERAGDRLAKILNDTLK